MKSGLQSFGMLLIIGVAGLCCFVLVNGIEESGDKEGVVLAQR